MFSELQKKFSETGIAPAQPPFKGYAEASSATALLMVDSTKVCGSIWADAEGRLRSTVNMQTQMQDADSVGYVLVNGSDEALFPLKVGPQLLSWFPVVLPRRAVPAWAPKGNELTSEILSAARFDAVGLANPVLALIPMTAIFGFRTSAMLDNVDLFDPEVQEDVEKVHGEDVADWARLLALALTDNKWTSFVDVYNEVERLKLLPIYLGDRFENDKLVIWRNEPTISIIPMTEKSHAEDFAKIKDTIGLIKDASPSPGGSTTSTTAALPPIEIVTGEMKREVAELKNGERLLIGICMAGSYDETSNTITGFKFPEFTDAMKKAIGEPIKSERAQDVKRLFDSANALRDEASKYNLLVKLKNMPDHDISMITALLTGGMSRTSIKQMTDVSTDVCALQWLPHGKERARALRKERSRSQWENNNDVNENDRSKKRDGFAPPQLIKKLVDPQRLIANLIGDLSAMFKHDSADTRSLFYKELLKLFDFLTTEAEDWIEEVGQMPLFPVYACLMIDKLMCGFVTAASSYTNDIAIREHSLGAFDLEPYRKAVSAYNKTLKSIRENVDNDAKWTNYPTFLEDMYRPSHPQKKQKVDDNKGGHGNTNQGSSNAYNQGGGNGGSNGGNHQGAANGGSNGTANGGNQNAGNGGGQGGTRRRAGSHGGNGFNKGSSGSFDAKTKGCFVLVDDKSFPALCPEVDKIVCADFATVGYSCPGCDKKHTWYDKYGKDLKSAQEAYVEKHKDKVRFNKGSYGVRKNLPQDKYHLLSSGEN